ncbi:hypothetical protein SUDANB121_01069 [Nocardiopsis dassonvillei]|uniref:DUF6098 family protein n=1 Tax=Nocardiopsis dassonvillei TaxID=2014 RepID=UPI003F55661F
MAETRPDFVEHDGLPVARDLRALAVLVSDPRPLYLRYSEGPERDASVVSKDYESGLELPGLSVTPLTPEPWWTRPLEDWLARQVRKYASLAEEDTDRYGWALHGRVVARGPDHEPLLDRVEPVARLGTAVMDEALERYRRRFEAGRGPTDD